MFLVRIPLSYGLGLLARRGADRLTSGAFRRIRGIPGDAAPEARDLSVKFRYVLGAVLVEAAAFAITKALADRGAEQVSRALTGRSAVAKGTELTAPAKRQ